MMLYDINLSLYKGAWGGRTRDVHGAQGCHTLSNTALPHIHAVYRTFDLYFRFKDKLEHVKRCILDMGEAVYVF